jgi:hypothetical protein
MAARDGTRHRYNDGCRCEDCTASNAAHQQEYRTRPTSVVHLPTAVTPPSGPGPVESGVQAELEGLTEARPGLAQVALALARVLDDPRATSQKAAAARVLVVLLDELRSASAPARRGHLAAVRTMSKKGGA